MFKAPSFLATGKRLFSQNNKAAVPQELLFAKRCENGQGSSFVFENIGRSQGGRLDVSYSTFWNDFSHYSYYSQPSAKFPAISAPIAYNQLGNATEDMLFADIEKFVNAGSSASFLDLNEQPVGENKREVWRTHQDAEPVNGLFCAHIPQDFNLDVRTTGNIIGVNPGDSKLLALKVHLESEMGSVTARRLRADDCHLSGSQVQILSAIEAANLVCETGSGGFIVSRRVGIGKKGRIDSGGQIRIGSVFSKMQDLPEVMGLAQDDDLSQMTFDAGIQASHEHVEGLFMTAEDDIHIDNMHGIVTLQTSQPSKINLHTVESVKMVINAPNAHVSLNLKSIHDLSYINCHSAEIIINEEFDQCNIYDQKKQQFFLREDFAADEDDQEAGRPTLKVFTQGELNIRVMSNFEILRKQIESKMQARLQPFKPTKSEPIVRDHDRIE